MTRAVLVTADVLGQTQGGFDGILAAFGNALKEAPGFILVTGLPVAGSGRTLEVWERAHDATEFYAEYVHPNLPPGLEPKRTFRELHSSVSISNSKADNEGEYA